MQISFSLYDILGYILPGIFLLCILLILIHPDIWEHPLNDEKKGLVSYLPTNTGQGILYGCIAYLLGFMLGGCTAAFFKITSKISEWKWLGKLNISGHIGKLNTYGHSGWFVKRLLEADYRDASGDPNPYSGRFICKFKKQIEEIFAISIGHIDRVAEYTEIFDYCRHTLMKQSPAVYARALILYPRYESAKLMMSASIVATVTLLARVVQSGAAQGFLLYLAIGTFLLILPFFFMYKQLLGYYRKTILYGFYEYAINREKSRDSGNSEN